MSDVLHRDSLGSRILLVQLWPPVEDFQSASNLRQSLPKTSPTSSVSSFSRPPAISKPCGSRARLDPPNASPSSVPTAVGGRHIDLVLDRPASVDGFPVAYPRKHSRHDQDLGAGEGQLASQLRSGCRSTSSRPGPEAHDVAERDRVAGAESCSARTRVRP